MRWTQVADRRDECPPPLPRWALLLKEERLEMHSNTPQSAPSSYAYVQKRKKKRAADHFTTEEEKEKKSLKMSTKKVTWLLLSDFTHTLMGEKKKEIRIPTTLALVPLKHIFPQVEAVHTDARTHTHTQTLRNLILLKIVPPRRKKKKSSHGLDSPSENTPSFPTTPLYNSSAAQRLAVRHWEGTTLRELGNRRHTGWRGGGACILPTVCLLSSPARESRHPVLFCFFRDEPLLGCFCLFVVFQFSTLERIDKRTQSEAPDATQQARQHAGRL